MDVLGNQNAKGRKSENENDNFHLLSLTVLVRLSGWFFYFTLNGKGLAF